MGLKLFSKLGYIRKLWICSHSLKKYSQQFFYFLKRYCILKHLKKISRFINNIENFQTNKTFSAGFRYNVLKSFYVQYGPTVIIQIIIILFEFCFQYLRLSEVINNLTESSLKCTLLLKRFGYRSISIFPPFVSRIHYKFQKQPPEVFYEKGFLKILQNSQETPDSLF